jgi:hypothetical protein
MIWSQPISGLYGGFNILTQHLKIKLSFLHSTFSFFFSRFIHTAELQCVPSFRSSVWIKLALKYLLVLQLLL